MNANIFQYTQMQFAHLADISRRTIRDNDIFQIPGEGVPKYPLERKFQRGGGDVGKNSAPHGGREYGYFLELHYVTYCLLLSQTVG